jgi:glycerophosphoryl diester phosphodiesterase
MTMLDQLPRPAIIAHRGASAHAPENTLAAFSLAVRQGADAIELDAKLSADEQVVVFHDQTLERTTAAPGWVHRAALAELRQLDAGSHFDVAFQGERIPTLDEVFSAVGRQIFINIELTNYARPFDDLPSKVAELVIRHQLVGRVWFSSFNPVALRRIHQALPQVPLALLAFPGWRGGLARSRIGPLLAPYKALTVAIEDASSLLVGRLRQGHKRLLVYTVNQPEEMQRLFEMQVDGIFTDDPPLAQRILAAAGGKSSEQR